MTCIRIVQSFVWTLEHVISYEILHWYFDCSFAPKQPRELSCYFFIRIESVILISRKDLHYFLLWVRLLKKCQDSLEDTKKSLTDLFIHSGFH